MSQNMTLDQIYQANKTVQGTFFKFKADRLPFLYVMLVATAQLWAYFTLSHAAAGAFAILSLPFLGSIAIYNHHQQHHGAFNYPILNRFFELVMGIQTMIPAYAWVLHHNFGHHPNYMNQRGDGSDADKEDESRWTRKDGSTMGSIEYTLNLILMAPVDGYKVGMKQKRVFKNYWLMAIPTVGLQVVMLYLNWVNFLLVILLPAMTMLIYVYWLTHEHHSGLYTKNELEASRNRVGRWYNIRACNLGYHTAHHMKPYIHWSLLPHYHELIKEDIPERCFVPCW